MRAFTRTCSRRPLDLFVRIASCSLALAFAWPASEALAQDMRRGTLPRDKYFLEGSLGYGIQHVGVGPSDFFTRGVAPDGRVVDATYSGKKYGFVRPSLHTIEMNIAGGVRNGPMFGMPMAFHWGSRDRTPSDETAWTSSGPTMYGFSMGLQGGWLGQEGPLTFRGTLTLGFRALMIPVQSLTAVDTGSASVSAALLRGYLEPRLGMDLRLSRITAIGVWTGGDLFHLGEYSYGTCLVFRTP